MHVPLPAGVVMTQGECARLQACVVTVVRLLLVVVTIHYQRESQVVPATC